MGDMLIRGIDPELKRRLEESARLNKRSLSDEAIVVMQRGFAAERAGAERAGDRLYSLVGDAHFTGEEIQAIASARSEPDRAPPQLE